MNLTKHRVLVTGGSSGIGLEIAAEFVKRGNNVAICGRDLDKLKFAQTNIGAQAAIQCDLAEEFSVPTLVAETKKRLGGLSILVNNAGVQYNYDLSEANPNEVLLDATDEISVNFTSLVALTSACIPLLKANEEAAIVNISSGLAVTPKASAPVYCATKAAVHSFSKSLRYQLRESLPHVRVFEVMPPLVDTNMTSGRDEDNKMKPKDVAAEVFSALRSNRTEVKVGKVKLLSLLQRLSPRLAAGFVKDK